MIQPCYVLSLVYKKEQYAHIQYLVQPFADDTIVYTWTDILDNCVAPQNNNVASDTPSTPRNVACRMIRNDAGRKASSTG